MTFAKAYPRKHFFVEMFTRDISLADCILDLIDNSIDGLMKSRKLNVLEYIFDDAKKLPKKDLPVIKITFTENFFKIEDNCGGIPYKLAAEDIFNFGYPHDHSPAKAPQLGVYGIGLKRAIFKMGTSFEMKSSSSQDGFTVKLDNLAEWLKKDDQLSDWQFPIVKTGKAANKSVSGTVLTIKNLRAEVKAMVESDRFFSAIEKEIGKVYALFINKLVKIEFNGKLINPLDIPIGSSSEVTPGKDEFKMGEVDVKIIATMAPRSTWKMEQAGWYVACNGRLVLLADKTDVTGWGKGILPNFHDKYRGFVGLVFFQSEDALSLPWKTTKRGLNEENQTYQKTIGVMSRVARPVVSFFDKMYKPEVEEERNEREVADAVTATNVRVVAAQQAASFAVVEKRQRQKTTLKIQYDAEKIAINRIKTYLRKPQMSASQVGKHTFEFFIKKEGLR